MAANFGLILVCLSLGLWLRRSGRLPATAPALLNGFIIHVSLPAMALLNLHEIAWSRELLYPVSMPWIFFVAGGLFFFPLGKFLGWRSETIGALMLTGGLCNTSFVGFPLLVALFGPESLKIGVLTDQPGSFLVLSSLGVLTASALGTRKRRLSELPAYLLRFPPFVAFLLAIALHPWPFPPAAKEILEKLQATLIPLALVSVGMQLRLSPARLRRHASTLAAGLLFKLVLGPALIFALFVGLLGARGWEVQITVVQAAMAPMITGAILAADQGLEPELANLMISAGIPLSLLTVPLWSRLLGSL